MKKTLLLYALALAIAAFALEWLEYQKLMRTMRTEAYVILLAFGFAALGVWIGVQLTRRRNGPKATAADAVRKAMAITEREFEVLQLLNEGKSTKELARNLGVSPNTIKTHLARLYSKLECDSRLQAVKIGRRTGLLP